VRVEHGELVPLVLEEPELVVSSSNRYGDSLCVYLVAYVRCRE
jgi:hypothetical protein